MKATGVRFALRPSHHQLELTVVVDGLEHAMLMPLGFVSEHLRKALDGVAFGMPVKAGAG